MKKYKEYNLTFQYISIHGFKRPRCLFEVNDSLPHWEHSLAQLVHYSIYSYFDDFIEIMESILANTWSDNEFNIEGEDNVLEYNNNYHDDVTFDLSDGYAYFEFGRRNYAEGDGKILMTDLIQILEEWKEFLAPLENGKYLSSPPSSI